MKFSRAFLLPLCLAATSAFAGTGRDYSTTANNSTVATDTDTVVPWEFDLEYAYIGNSSVDRSFRRVGEFDENYGLARFIYRPRTPIGYLRLGAAYERFDFGLPRFSRLQQVPPPEAPPVPIPIGAGIEVVDGYFVGRPQIPDTLQSVSAVVGLDTKFTDSLLFRIEAQPGFYGANHLNSDDFNVPFVIGGTYIYNPNFQFIFGVSVDFDRKYPVFPGGGIRWRFAPQWVLNAAVPTPRLEFEATRSLTLYAGGDLKGSTFRVGDQFGDNRLDPRLNHAVLTYSEIRVGGGLEWKLTPGFKLSVEGGYLPYREFDYHRADVRYRYDTGAPYGAVGLHAAF